MAGGRGSGEHNNEDGIIAGSALSAGLAICCCVIGVPVILTGVIMVIVADPGTDAYIVGVTLIVISLLVLVCGVVVIVLLCAGVCQKNRGDATAVVYPSPVTVVHPPTYAVAATVSATHYPQPGARQNDYPMTTAAASSSFSGAPPSQGYIPAASYSSHAPSHQYPPPGAPPLPPYSGLSDGGDLPSKPPPYSM